MNRINATPQSAGLRISGLVKVRAFTLIELLTVIAIIGILAAIIIPVVGKVREAARASQCLSNIRQIAMALNMFADDHREFYPTVGNNDWIKSASAVPTGEMPGIFDYLAGQRVSTAVYWAHWNNRFRGTALICPTNEARNPSPYSYGLNEMLTERIPARQVPGMGASKNFAARWRVTSPSQAMLVIESNQWRAKLPGSTGGEEPVRIPRHGSQINLAYVDGHVGKIRYEDIPTSADTNFWAVNGN